MSDFSAKEVAEFLGISRNQVYQMLQRKREEEGSDAPLGHPRRLQYVLQKQAAPSEDAWKRVAEHMAEILRPVLVRQSSPWLSAPEAAEYLRCPLSRIRKLTATGDLPHEREGRRVLYRREELDEFIRKGGGTT